jgi:glycosyltransferase involved in cell wall biosynthesis
MQKAHQASDNNSAKGVVALVANLAWSIYNFRLPVIRALHREGYRVIVIAPVDETVSILLREPGVEFVGLQSFRRNSTNVISSLKMTLEFQRIYQRTRPDIVIHYGVQANVWGNFGARLAGVPSVCVVTGLGYTFLHTGFIPWVTRWLYRLSFLKTAKIVFENQEDQELLIKKAIVRRENTLRVPGCGVDTNYFKPSTVKKKSRGPVFLFMGRLLYDKGIREFAAAAARLKTSFPEAECWILGHLDDQNPAHIQRNELVNWVQSGYIQYKGASDDVRPFVAQADWVVLPSYREGLSKVLLEAMSMAKPIITTDTPGCSETVREGQTGFIVPVKDNEKLYQVMRHGCAIEAEQRHYMGNEARLIAIEYYDATLVGALYVRLVAEIMSNKH